MEKMKFLRKEWVEIEDLWSYAYNKPITEINYIDFLREMLEHPQRKFKNYGYYKWMVAEFEKKGNVFEEITKFEDICPRVGKAWSLLFYIKHWGLNDREIPTQYNLGGSPRGNLTVFEKEGKIWLMDGHHRVSILYILDYKSVKVEMYEKND